MKRRLQARLLQPARHVVPFMIAAIFVMCVQPAWAQDEHPVEAAGVQPSRAYLSLLPWESIDVYSGSLVLTFTDLVLPGNAGFDFRFTRSYNSKGPERWRVGPGFIRHADSGETPAQNPRIVTPDGGVQRTFQAGADSPIFRTLSYWEYDRDTHELRLPNGIAYEYECARTLSNTRYPTTARDPFGNTITFSYDSCEPNAADEPLLESVSQDLGNGQVRTVTFGYLDGRVRTMTYEGREWTYTWEGSFLKEVTPPVGSGWRYEHDDTFRVSKVTTPQGGEVSYAFESVTIGTRGTLALTRRETWGRGVPAGVWTLHYHPARTDVESPLNTTTYSFEVPLTDSEGTPSGRNVQADGITLEKEAYQWQQSADVGFPETTSSGSVSPFRPLIHVRTVTRQGRSWQTTYDYHGADFNDYGQPYRITETGDFTRTTERGFWSSGAHYIRAMVSQETTSGDGQSFTVSASRNAQGFVLSRSAYGTTTTYEPDAFGNVEVERDANQHATTYHYAWGALRQIIAPHHTTTREINPDGTVRWEERGGYKTTFGYDDLGRETDRRLLDVPNGEALIGDPITTHYEPDGSFVKTERGDSWMKAFLDGFGRPTGTEDATGVKTDTSYYPWGGRQYESYPYETTSIGTTLEYDGLGRITKKTSPDASCTTFDYEKDDATRIHVTDENFQTLTQVWEASGDPGRARLKSVTDPADATTTYTYDVLDTLTKVAHPNATSRTWSYDPTSHRLLSETHPESGQTSYGDPDAVGNPRKRTDAKGVVLTYGYDGENRLTSIGAPIDAYDTTFEYDEWGNRKLVENAYVKRELSFKAHRLTKIQDAVRAESSDVWYDFVTDLDYDGRDNLKTITYPAGPRRTIRYGYDAANRVNRVSEDGGPVYAESFSYHPSGGISSYTSGNGIVNTMAHEVEHQRYWPGAVGATGVLSLSYKYDAVGNVEQINGAPSGNQSFQYDSVDRLQLATGPWGTEKYHYDSVGNRDWKEDPSRTDYLYPGGRLTAATGAHAETFSYDGSGNLESDGRGTYAYTPFNMLDTATMGTGVAARYRYDGDHLRTVSTISGVHRFFLRGPGAQLLTEVKQEGSTTSWVRDYIYAGGRLIASVRDARATLTVSKVGHGSGVVRIQGPANLDAQCGSACTHTLPADVSVTLTAAAAPGSRFVGWEGACAGSGLSTTLTLAADATCVARFIVPTPLTVTLAGGGAGVVTSDPPGITCPAGACQAEYDIQTDVALTALESSSSLFIDWSGDPDCADGRVHLAAAVTCTATFKPAFVLTVAKTGPGASASTVTSHLQPGGRQISCGIGGGLCVNKFVAGEPVTLQVTAPPWAVFVGWSGDGCGTGAVMMDRDRSCTAGFAVNFPKVSPASGTASVPVRPMLEWSSAKPTPNYWVCWDRSDDSQCDANNWRPNGSAAVTGVPYDLLPGTTYYWQVRLRLLDDGTEDAYGDDGVWWSFTTAGTAPTVAKTSPAPEAGGLGSSVRLEWVSSLADAGYVVCWGPSATGPDCPLTGGWAPTGMQRYRDLHGLAAGTYYWQVRADAGVGSFYGDGGAWHRFTVGTSASPPGTFTKTAPAAGATDVAQPVTLSWGASSGATSYAYCLDEVVDGTCSAAWQAVSSGTSVSVSDLTGGGTYEWQVKALNNAGEAAASDGWRTFTVQAAAPPPAAVQKASPASGATVSTGTPTLTWTSSLTNVGYAVCWSTTPGGESCALAGGWAPNGQALSKMVYPALTPGTYYWQVRAQTAAGYEYGDGAAAAWWTFTVPGTPPPGPFTLTTPASGATNQPTSVTLSWGPSSGAASYTYCLDTTLGGSCSGTWQSAGAATSVTVGGLTSGATYEWHVRATNGTGTTDATGAWRTFTVATAAPLTKTSPASGTTGLGSPVILTWTSTLTNVAYTVCWDQTPDGTCSGVWWPNGGSKVKWLENLAAGTYYWQVRAQTPTGYVYADGEPTSWAFTVGSDPMAEASASGPSAGDGLRRRPSDEPSAWPIGAPLAIALLTLMGVLGLRRHRPRRVRRWAVPAWLSLLALLWPVGVAAQDGTRVEYYHLDALGSVRVVTDASGQVVRRHDFGPFGEEVAAVHPNPERKLFTGQERDAETALDYFGARYYRADLGRFTTPDPLGFTGGGSGYAYVENNPLRFVDPTGLQREAPSPQSTPLTFRTEITCDKKCQEALWQQLAFGNFVILKNTAPPGDATPGSVVRKSVETLLLMRDWARQEAMRDKSTSGLEVRGSVCGRQGSYVTPPFEMVPAPCGSLGCPTGTSWIADLHLHPLNFGQQQPSMPDVYSAIGRPGVYNFVWTAYGTQPGGVVWQYNSQGAVWTVWGTPVPYFTYW